MLSKSIQLPAASCLRPKGISTKHDSFDIKAPTVGFFPCTACLFALRRQESSPDAREGSILPQFAS